MAQPIDFLTLNNGHPLVIGANSPVIPQATFNVFPKYDGSSKTLYEHYKYVSFLASNFDITNETMMTRLLSHSFEGKAIESFITLIAQSINSWGELCQALIKRFAMNGDDSTFLSLIACIERHPHESINDFNIRFERTSKSIIVRIRPTSTQDLMYHRKSFLLNLNMLIVMLGDTFPDVYQIAKTSRHTFISFGKM